MDIKSLFLGPIFFEKNRVERIYTGGKLFSEFFLDDSTDGYFPEEWVVSSTVALNKNMRTPKDGVSVVRDMGIYFDDLLKDYKTEILGDREEFGVLTKVLDSAIRLPVQAHPDKAFSKKHFNSNYGKAESWIVLATRENAALYFGFKEKISKSDFAKAVEESKTNKEVMEPLLNRVPVKPGDVFFVPAKMMHAIGKGCLILEIQEPSDFTIQPEYYCGEYELSLKEMYIGLDKDTALDVFDYDVFGEKAVEMGRRTPKTITQEDGVKKEALITYEDTPCFAVTRYILNGGSVVLEDKPCVYVITEGSGKITYNNTEKEVKKGDYFLLPYSAKETKIFGNLTVVACLPPQK